MKLRIVLVNDSNNNINHNNVSINNLSNDRIVDNKIVSSNVLINKPLIKTLSIKNSPNANNFINEEYPSNHMCYIIQSIITKRVYIGYTVDFTRRIRQHNGEIVGGAKKTTKGRPWTPIGVIKGFLDHSNALRFEFRMHKSKKPRPNSLVNVLVILQNLINKGDGVLSWPPLTIEWYNNNYRINNVNNVYV